MKNLPEGDSQLNELELEVIEIFVHLFKLFGAPKSVGAIYGFLFTVDHPVAMEEIASKLDVSLGSASQGLKTLRTLGAVKPVYVQGDRRTLYEAEMNLRSVISKQVSDVIFPQIDNAKTKISGLGERVRNQDFELNKELKIRIGILERLSKRSNVILPAIKKIFEI
ncbi:MAG: hypothetical protein MI748_09530 [Opitutales bacterium]|nr:hypothetical protein [Opitutales bacterium]